VDESTLIATGLKSMRQVVERFVVRSGQRVRDDVFIDRPLGLLDSGIV
jgi:hypothetical protein